MGMSIMRDLGMITRQIVLPIRDTISNEDLLQMKIIACELNSVVWEDTLPDYLLQIN